MTAPQAHEILMCNEKVLELKVRGGTHVAEGIGMAFLGRYYFKWACKDG